MAKELFKTATAGTINNLLFHFNGVSLTKLPILPPSFTVSEDPVDQWAKLELQYTDFKEAFCKLNLIARTCNLMNYRPEIFNVYNRIEVRLYTSNSRNDKTITWKDVYVAYFLHELQNQTVENSHKNAISKIN